MVSFIHCLISIKIRNSQRRGKNLITDNISFPILICERVYCYISCVLKLLMCAPHSGERAESSAAPAPAPACMCCSPALRYLNWLNPLQSDTTMNAVLSLSEWATVPLNSRLFCATKEDEKKKIKSAHLIGLLAWKALIIIIVTKRDIFPQAFAFFYSAVIKTKRISLREGVIAQDSRSLRYEGRG